MKKNDVIKVIQKLREFYPDATCSLDFKTPFQMVVAVMLSAQCTDERVNKTTPNLFKKYGTPEAICELELAKLEIPNFWFLCCIFMFTTSINSYFFNHLSS